MEKADSIWRATKHHPNPLPVLAILAKDASELATNEMRVFSPILKRWHPFAAGVAVATLHSCYGNELKQFISELSELTPDVVQILRAANKLEQDLVQIAVEDAVESDDGGKSIIREMPPFEAEAVIASLVKAWITSRTDKMMECVDRQESWAPIELRDGCALSAIEVLRIIDETLHGYFQLPIPMHPALLPDLIAGLDKCLHYYINKARSGCGTKSTFTPAMPALTRCTVGAKFQPFGKKKDKSTSIPKRNSQVSTTNGDDNIYAISQLCLRINTLQQIRLQLEGVEKRIITHLRNSESAQLEDFSENTGKKFELSPPACIEGIQQLCEAVGYRVVFHDLRPVLWDWLYVGDPGFSRIDMFLQELERYLVLLSDSLSDRVRARIFTDVMQASFDGFLLVLLAGGPSRAFSRNDSPVIDDDFKTLKDLFWANGDGLPMDLIDKFSTNVREILPLFRTDTESLIDRFRHLVVESNARSRSRIPLPPTSGQWSPTDPNTILRVLCYRNDEAATKFLKKTYNLPKKL